MLDDPELVRWWAVTVSLMFASAGAYVYGRHLHAGPPIVRLSGLVVGVYVTLVAAAIVVNIASPFPPTPGVKVYAVIVTVLTASFVALVWRHRAD